MTFVKKGVVMCSIYVQWQVRIGIEEIPHGVWS